MPKISNPIHRLHMSLFKSEVNLLRIIAKKNNLTISGLIRKIIKHFLDDYQAQNQNGI